MTTVLLVCPANDLKYARSERANWDSAIHLRVVEVAAPVTVVSVTRTLQAEQPDGLAILGHGTQEGIPLDDGELLDYPTLVPFLGSVRWCYLGVCDSLYLAQQIAAMLHIPVLATIGNVYDRHAYSQGSGLAYALDGGDTFEHYANAMTVRGDKQRGFRLVLPPEPVPPATVAGPLFRERFMATV